MCLISYSVNNRRMYILVVQSVAISPLVTFVVLMKSYHLAFV